jgi:hypothetical protein
MKRSLAFTLLLFVGIVRADDFDTWFAASPDKKLVAIERRIPDSEEPSRVRIPLGSPSLYIVKLEQMKLSAHGKTQDEA